MEQSIQSNGAGSTEEVIRQRRQRTILRKLRGSDLRKAAFLAVFLVLLFRCVFGVTFEYGSDMKPAIGDKDLLLYYRLQDSYTGGDVVVYEKRGVEMVGRIAAMPGETVEITKDGQLVINGYTQADINQEDMYNPGNENGTGKVTLKSQQYYILSDLSQCVQRQQDTGSSIEKRDPGACYHCDPKKKYIIKKEIKKLL